MIVPDYEEHALQVLQGITVLARGFCVNPVLTRYPHNKKVSANRTDTFLFMQSFLLF